MGVSSRKSQRADALTAIEMRFRQGGQSAGSGHQQRAISRRISQHWGHRSQQPVRRRQWSERWPCNRRDPRQSAMGMKQHRTDPRWHSSCTACPSISTTAKIEKEVAEIEASAAQGPAAFGYADRTAWSGLCRFSAQTSHHRRFARRCGNGQASNHSTINCTAPEGLDDLTPPLPQSHPALPYRTTTTTRPRATPSIDPAILHASAVAFALPAGIDILLRCPRRL